MKTHKKIIEELLSLSSQDKAISMQRFFKTEKGQYGEGDKFHGVSVPQQRLIAKKFESTCNGSTLISLLDSEFHEERLTAIFILVEKFKKGLKTNDEKQWVDLYVQKIERVNNWDLVDSSAHLILGKWLENRKRTILYDLATSSNLWRNRVSIVATLHFIRNNDFTDLLKLAKIMLTHQHDLIHKATGWMLREAWQRDPKLVEHFLDNYKQKMPRTMLRYTIEKMSDEKRKRFMKP